MHSHDLKDSLEHKDLDKPSKAEAGGQSGKAQVFLVRSPFSCLNHHSRAGVKPTSEDSQGTGT